MIDKLAKISKSVLRKLLDDHRKWLESNGKKGHIAHLSGKDLKYAEFAYSDLRSINFSGSDLRHSNFHEANLKKADFRKAALGCVEFTGADLSEANLSHAGLWSADLELSKLIRANLNNAFLYTANLNQADLSYADLSEAALFSANLTGVLFYKTILTHAYLAQTVFSLTDLTNAIGLDQCFHMGYSAIDYITLSRSKGLPLSFLRACGLPEKLIAYLPSLSLETIKPYSCFISYASLDQEFADLLYKNLQDKGVRCWYAPRDLTIGARIRQTLDEKIQLHEKLLLVLSKNSINSAWVEQEVETALARERKNTETILFPIRLDDDVMQVQSGWPALIKNTRHIGDFRNWKKPDIFRKKFSKLLSDLLREVEESRTDTEQEK
jgi:uncharacterized protein YjbI with pentapeptide repeats